jgi:hypothetical protein
VARAKDGDHVVCDFLAAAARAMRELQDQLDRAVRALALVALDVETLAAHGHDQSLVGGDTRKEGRRPSTQTVVAPWRSHPAVDR